MNKTDVVRNIKYCGESLIYNAEKIAGNLPEYAKNLSLTCYPSEVTHEVYISVGYDFIPENIVNKYNPEEAID